MYYQNYEDYMRSILGYPIRQNEYINTFENCNMNDTMLMDYPEQTPRYSDEIMDLYPEIYKIINPMVCKICEANTKPIDRELIEKMTDEIYLNIESDPSLVESDIVNVRVNLPKENTKETNANSLKSTHTLPTSNRIRDNRSEKKENREEKKESTRIENNENRQRSRNNTLRDLIRILILNRLLGRDIRPPRPRPPRPGRPPFPGMPGPNPRPPMRPRDVYASNPYLTNGNNI